MHTPRQDRAFAILLLFIWICLSNPAFSDGSGPLGGPIRPPQLQQEPEVVPHDSMSEEAQAGRGRFFLTTTKRLALIQVEHTNGKVFNIAVYPSERHYVRAGSFLRLLRGNWEDVKINYHPGLGDDHVQIPLEMPSDGKRVSLDRILKLYRSKPD